MLGRQVWMTSYVKPSLSPRAICRLFKTAFFRANITKTFLTGDHMAITVEGIRYLISVPDVTDEQIQWYIDNGYTNPLSICVALCDYMASIASNDTDIKVGPISLSSSQSADAWNKLKKDFILRINTGADSGGLLGSFMGVGGATLTGAGMQPAIQRGQFDNPPVTLESGGRALNEGER